MNYIFPFPCLYVSASHAHYLEKSVTACINEYLDTENAGGDDLNKTPKSNGLTPTSMSVKQYRMHQTEDNSIPPRVLCVEAICDIVTEQLPDLWRLGQSYFTGQLHVTVDTEKQGPFKVSNRISMLHAIA